MLTRAPIVTSLRFCPFFMENSLLLDVKQAACRAAIQPPREEPAAKMRRVRKRQSALENWGARRAGLQAVLLCVPSFWGRGSEPGLQLGTQLLAVKLQQRRAGDAVADGAGLAGNAAAGDAASISNLSAVPVRFRLTRQSA